MAESPLKGGGNGFPVDGLARSNFDFWAAVSFHCTMEIDPRVAGFILYCTRNNKKWPALYDEMCRVAGRGLYEGLRNKDLRKMGLSFGLNRLEETVRMIEAVTGLEVAGTSLEDSVS